MAAVARRAFKTALHRGGGHLGEDAGDWLRSGRVDELAPLTGERLFERLGGAAKTRHSASRLRRKLGEAVSAIHAAATELLSWMRDIDARRRKRACSACSR